MEEAGWYLLVRAINTNMGLEYRYFHQKPILHDDNPNRWEKIDNILSILPENEYYFHFCKETETIVFIKCRLAYFDDYVSGGGYNEENYYVDSMGRNFYDIPYMFDINFVLENQYLNLIYFECEEIGVHHIWKKGDVIQQYHSNINDTESDDDDLQYFGYDVDEYNIVSYTIEFRDYVLK